jgi:hypothetical protein
MQHCAYMDLYTFKVLVPVSDLVKKRTKPIEMTNKNFKDFFETLVEFSVSKRKFFQKKNPVSS